MTLPGYWPIRAWGNQDFSEPFTFLQPNGSLQNVGAWVSSMQVYDDVGGTLVLDIQSSGSFANGGAAGTITPQVAEAVMRAIAPGLYTYDYRAFSNGGAVAAWLHGPFVLEKGVSQDTGLVPVLSPAVDTAVTQVSSSGLTRTFAVINNGAQPAEVSFVAAFSGQVTAASCSPLLAVIPGNGGRQTVTITYSTSATGGAGAITVTVTAIAATITYALAVTNSPDFAGLSLSVANVGYWDIRSLSPGAVTSWPPGTGAGAPAPTLTGSGTVVGTGAAAYLQVANTAGAQFHSPNESAYDLSQPITLMGIDYGDDYNGTDTFGFYAALADSTDSPGIFTDRKVTNNLGKDGLAGPAGAPSIASKKDMDGKLRLWFLSLTGAAKVETLEFFPIPGDSQTLGSAAAPGGRTVSFGGFPSTGESWRGRGGAVFAGILNATDKRTLVNWASVYHNVQNDPGIKYISFDGDSRTLGFPSSTSDSTAGYCVQAMATAGVSGYGWANFGIGGELASNMAATYSTKAHVAITQSTSAKKLAVVWGGINDANGGQTAAQIYASLKSYWQQARADGALAVAVTEISWVGVGWDGGEKETLNALIKSDPTQYDLLFDFGATALGADGANANRTYFQNDGTHPTQAGYAILAAVAAAVVGAA